MHSSTMPAPPPPYATGSDTPSHPSSANCRNNLGLFESRPPSVNSARCSAVPQVSAQNLSTACANSCCSSVNISVSAVGGEFGRALLADRARQIAGAEARVEGSDPRTVLSGHRAVGGDRIHPEQTGFRRPVIASFGTLLLLPAPAEGLVTGPGKANHSDSRTSPRPCEGTDHLFEGACPKRVVPLGSVDGAPRRALVSFVGDVGELGHGYPSSLEAAGIALRRAWARLCRFG